MASPSPARNPRNQPGLSPAEQTATVSTRCELYAGKQHNGGSKVPGQMTWKLPPIRAVTTGRAVGRQGALTCPTELSRRAGVCLREGRKEAGDVLRSNADASVCRCATTGCENFLSQEPGPCPSVLCACRLGHYNSACSSALQDALAAVHDSPRHVNSTCKCLPWVATTAARKMTSPSSVNLTALLSRFTCTNPSW